MGTNRLLQKLVIVGGLFSLGCVLVTGCAVTQLAGEQMAELTVLAKGEYYLKREKYRQGIAALEQAAARHPQDADIYYYLGRYHLALDEIPAAEKAFKQATRLVPTEADYFFWWGVALGAAGQPRQERQAYQQCLRLDPLHPQALIYLGHNLLDAKQYQQALNYYDLAVQRTPTNPQVLYNQAYALGKLKRVPEAVTAWKIYLAHYPASPYARRAVHHLNQLGDFDYRIYLIGKRRVPVPRIRFTSLGSVIDSPSRITLDGIGGMVAENQQLVLQILTFQENDLPLAKSRAMHLKAYLLDRFPQLDAARIQISWFQTPQKLKIENNTHRLASSVHFFTTR